MNSLKNVLDRCKDIIERKETHTNSIKWLNNVCREFKTLFHGLHTVLTTSERAGSIGNSGRETCLLCITQISSCIRFLERTVKAERSSGVELVQTRQLFLDRILWCLSKLTESTANQPESMHKPPAKMVTSNFVIAIDTALDLISPLTMFGEDPSEDCLESAQIATIREIIHSLIGHALSFANLAQPDDQQPLTTICQSILREYMSFERIALIDCGPPSSSVPYLDNRSQCQMNATRLENSLYQLDGLVNDSLLRLVYGVFVEMNAKPLDVLAELIECDEGHLKNQKDIDAQIVRFDEMADRLQLIGDFAAAFAQDQRDQIAIRSALASFESLEPVLIPALLTTLQSPEHSAILTQHWIEESTKLVTIVQRIIDSYAFCVCICEHVSATIVQLQRKYDRSKALTTIAHCSIFQEHLRSNWSDLETDESTVEKANNFKLISIECRAAVDACEKPAEWPRVIKRFRIMLGLAKKLCAALKDASCEEKENVEFTVGHVTLPNSLRAHQRSPLRIVAPVDSLVAINGEDVNALFESFGVAPATRNSILYSSNGNRRSSSRSNKVIIKASNLALTTQQIARKPSLRSCLFKRAIPHSVVASKSANSTMIDDESFDLQITNILEQLTDLSTTLSNGF